jgi:hypothetical protein
MKKPIMLKISKWSILTINCHEPFEIFTNPPNPIAHLIVSSLKKVKRKK